MLIVDNFDKVKNVVQWKPEQTYYKFVALIRAKDYKDGEFPVLLDKEKQECFVRHDLFLYLLNHVVYSPLSIYLPRSH